MKTNDAGAFTPDGRAERARRAATDRGLWAIAAIVVGMGLVRVFQPETRPSLDDETLKYLLVGAILLLAPRLRTLSFGDVKVELEQLKAQAQRTDAKADEAAQEASVALRAATQTAGGGTRGERPAAAKSEIAAADSSSSDDPNHGRFGGASLAGGFRLRSAVRSLHGTQDLFEVILQVDAAPGSTAGSLPAGSSVVFHLHPTFPRPVVSVPVERGVARLDLVAWGAFTVGAVLPNGQTLELDLAGPEVQAPALFKSR